MAGHSKHSKGKKPNTKRSRAKLRAVTTVEPQHLPAPVSPEPAVSAKIPQKVKPRAASAKPVPQRYGYVFADLKRIGILAGIILVILVVLALVLK